ncbi:unnamed protein product [Parascedosporium putredinis]|uniref:Uncharacterized protein n=1 Tax=Parascedosporium putredinis TaxID=1442378 RepID=A0A9P1H5I6_9PEZI|nr:unnamed protein product [Parascedosporium putredinis]CAI7996948.1 unnamed protein product [Parascedosporium putredinis]
MDESAVISGTADDVSQVTGMGPHLEAADEGWVLPAAPKVGADEPLVGTFENGQRKDNGGEAGLGHGGDIRADAVVIELDDEADGGAGRGIADVFGLEEAHVGGDFGSLALDFIGERLGWEDQGRA